MLCKRITLRRRAHLIRELSFGFLDEGSIFITCIIGVVLVARCWCCFSLEVNLKKREGRVVTPILMIYIICYMFFQVGSKLGIYILYELSLLPIIYIITKLGGYPDRRFSSLLLFVYTSIFTLPLLVILLLSFSCSGSFLINENLEGGANGLFGGLIVILRFCVKLPVYGLHLWLPIAHVEAPTFGSMILAGVLLKLGGFGLIRFIDLIALRGIFIVAPLFLFFIVFVTAVCCFQSDLKRIIAYSSVSHIIAIPLLFLWGRALSIKRLIMIMVFHGLCSPGLFLLVGVVRNWIKTRQLLIIGGLATTSPLIRIFLLFFFFFTIAAPPFPSFITEVFFFWWAY